MGGYLMISIFPTIIHDIDVPTFKQIESDLLKFVYQEKKKDSGGVNISNVGGWQSKELGLDNILSETIRNRSITEKLYINEYNELIKIFSSPILLDQKILQVFGFVNPDILL